MRATYTTFHYLSGITGRIFTFSNQRKAARNTACFINGCRFATRLFNHKRCCLISKDVNTHATNYFTNFRQFLVYLFSLSHYLRCATFTFSSPSLSHFYFFRFVFLFSFNRLFTAFFHHAPHVRPLSATAGQDFRFVHDKLHPPFCEEARGENSYDLGGLAP